MNIWVWVIVLVGVIAVLFSVRRTRAPIVGVCESALDRTVRKNRNKERVLELLSEKGELKNSDIREVLGVSRQSIVRYLDELEKSGQVEQIDDSGRGVAYRKK